MPDRRTHVIQCADYALDSVDLICIVCVTAVAYLDLHRTFLPKLPLQFHEYNAILSSMTYTTTDADLHLRYMIGTLPAQF